MGQQLSLNPSDSSDPTENMPSDRVLIAFRVVAVAAVVAALGQVTLGGVVRVTDSGLGCPDWPLCHGKLIPPFDTATLIEYSHRLSASVLGLFVVAAAVLAWMRRSSAPNAFYASIAGVALVTVAAVLGGVTVLTELEWWYVLLHLSIAELLTASLVAAAIMGWGAKARSLSDTDRSKPSSADDATGGLIMGALAGAMALILFGSFMVGYGAGTSCATWPLCRGSLLPDGSAYAIHMGHRYIAAAVGLVMLAAAWRVWNAAHPASAVRVAAAAVFASFAAQIAVGAVVVWTGFDAVFKAVHLSLATVVWIALVAMAALHWIPQRISETEGARSHTGRGLAQERQ